jgi:hypothetical protein
MVVSPDPTTKVGDPPVVVLVCLLTIFTATLHCWRPSRHPQTEDAPSWGNMGSHITINDISKDWYKKSFEAHLFTLFHIVQAH